MTKKNSCYLGTNLKTKLSERFFFSIKKPILLVWVNFNVISYHALKFFSANKHCTQNVKSKFGN